ncbi:DUF3090 domain-containing protein [Aeromicrobium phragmitis]|uniref:DUF3090 domain-containing protein n=1 Tax=Aeromicrobium phragmitis TaxID=2478914 RepID=A0A3L8PRP3_9ACTN|nr:DUF3090 domain-containing protein [Aeromicrobium phragmitis]RLV57048.1 DUF3090 domain-containing protein [Aeromicrobium phragmitis]
MATVVHDFDWPDRFVVGTVGSPGQRTFYLQVRDGDRVVSVGMEKEQSAVLADRMDELLDELMSIEGNPASIPARAPEGLDDDDPLDAPVVEQFRVGMMTLGWDPSTAQVVIEAHPLVEGDLEETPDPQESPEVLQVRIPVGAARSFAKRAREVVLAGRPYCPLCLNPMDPEGHICPATDDFL